MTSNSPRNAVLDDGLPETSADGSQGEANPPEGLSALAGEYIGLTLAGGLVAGMLLGALLPRASRRKKKAGAGQLTAKAGEIGLAIAAQALTRAGAAVREGREKAVDMGELVSESLSERAAPVLASATRILGDGAEKARESGAAVARKAADIVAKVQSHS